MAYWIMITLLAGYVMGMLSATSICDGWAYRAQLWASTPYRKPNVIEANDDISVVMSKSQSVSATHCAGLIRWRLQPWKWIWVFVCLTREAVRSQRHRRG